MQKTKLACNERRDASGGAALEISAADVVWDMDPSPDVALALESGAFGESVVLDYASQPAYDIGGLIAVGSGVQRGSGQGLSVIRAAMS